MKNIIKITVIFVCILQAQLTRAQEPVNLSEKLTLSNEKVSFEFEPVNMGLTSMMDLVKNYEHIGKVDGKHLLWEVVFAKGKYIYTITNNYKPCSFASVETLPDGTKHVRMEWNRMRWWEEDDAVSVTVTIDLPKDEGIAKWRIFVENNSDYWGLWSVLFPIVNGFPESGEYDIARPSFARGGELIKSCGQKLKGRYPGSAWPMQFASFSNGSNSVYLASMDSEARAKDFVIEPIDGLEGQRYPILSHGRRSRAYLPDPGERIYIEHYVDDMGVQGSDYPDHYPVAFGVYQGDWRNAARIYRPWALEQMWTSNGPLSNRIDVPESILNTGVWLRDNWVWNDVEGSPEQMNSPLIDAAKKLDVQVGFHWYRWHTPPFDNQYPHYLPAKQGFAERVKILKEHDIIVMPYINGSSIDFNIPDYEDFEPHATRDQTGGLKQRYYSDNAGRLHSMCGNQGPWQDVVQTLTEKIKQQYGVNGIYIDQVSGLYHELCFDKSHLHSLGGGNYWAMGNRDLLNKVKNVAASKGDNMVVTSEGATEVFFDKLDANLFWSQPSDREIPLMQMVYSGYTLFFGSTCDYNRSDNYFRYAQGQAFIDGRQNGWMDLGLFAQEYKKKVEFLKQCGKHRVNATKYLTYGQLLDLVEPSGNIGSFTEEGFGWGRYEKQRTAEVPAAEARLWKSEDGKLAVFFANYTDEEVSFPYTITPADYGFDDGRWKVNELGLKSSKSAGEFGNSLNRVEKIGAGKIKVIELVPFN